MSHVHTWKENDEDCYGCLQCKASCHVLKILFKDQKPTFIVIGGVGTYCFVEKTSPDYKVEKPSTFLEKHLHESQSATADSVSEKTKIISFVAQSCQLPIG